MEDVIPPNETVYVKNLEESVKISELKDTLQELFQEYGHIRDLVAHANLKARGQAYIVFSDIESATKAIEEVNGFELFGKKMNLSYARSKSDATVKSQSGDEAFEKHKQLRLDEKERKKAAEQAARQEKESTSTALLSSTDQQTTAVGLPKPAGTGLKSTATAATVMPDEFLPPNKILFLQNIPADYQDVDVLGGMFCQYPRFKEVRLVPGRAGIAFVEYEDEGGATQAKEETSGLVLGEGDKPLKVTYQRQ